MAATRPLSRLHIITYVGLIDSNARRFASSTHCYRLFVGEWVGWCMDRHTNKGRRPGGCVTFIITVEKFIARHFGLGVREAPQGPSGWQRGSKSKSGDCCPY